MNAHDLHVTADFLEEKGWDGDVVLYLRGQAGSFHEGTQYGVCVTDQRFALTVRHHQGLVNAIRAEAKSAGLNPGWALLVTRYRDSEGIMLRTLPGDPGEIVFDREFYLTPDVVVELRKFGDDSWIPFATAGERRPIATRP